MGAILPRGTHHVVEGLLVAEGPVGLSLRVDGGGTWQIDGGASVRKMVNQRVRVEGTRSGFDMLDVATIVTVDMDTRSTGTGLLTRRL